jgi:purine nucleoside permease
MRFIVCVFLWASLLSGLSAQQRPWPVKVVIVTTFEVGKDTGDAPGEFQLWVEREHLTQPFDFPGGVHPILTNADHSILGIVSGTTLVNAATSVMALGLDPRFDLSHAYWLVNGIAGVDPNDASIGSAAWAQFVVGDVSRYIDPREAPADWPYGFFVIGAKEPNQPAPNSEVIKDRDNVFELNPGLVEWAYRLTRAIPLMDTPQAAAFRVQYTGFPNAQRPPFVLLGDSFASDDYWHGALSTLYANDWVKLFTRGRGNFVMTNMEDSAFAEAIRRLDRMHRADFQRLLVLRTGSNYCMPRPGHTALESVTTPYAGMTTAVENAWRIGDPVIQELVTHWDRYALTPPSAGPVQVGH